MAEIFSPAAPTKSPAHHSPQQSPAVGHTSKGSAAHARPPAGPPTHSQSGWTAPRSTHPPKRGQKSRPWAARTPAAHYAARHHDGKEPRSASPAPRPPHAGHSSKASRNATAAST